MSSPDEMDLYLLYENRSATNDDILLLNPSTTVNCKRELQSIDDYHDDLVFAVDIAAEKLIADIQDKRMELIGRIQTLREKTNKKGDDDGNELADKLKFARLQFVPNAVQLGFLLSASCAAIYAKMQTLLANPKYRFKEITLDMPLMKSDPWRHSGFDSYTMPLSQDRTALIREDPHYNSKNLIPTIYLFDGQGCLKKRVDDVILPELAPGGDDTEWDIPFRNEISRNQIACGGGRLAIWYKRLGKIYGSEFVTYDGYNRTYRKGVKTHRLEYKIIIFDGELNEVANEIVLEKCWDDKVCKDGTKLNPHLHAERLLTIFINDKHVVYTTIANDGILTSNIMDLQLRYVYSFRHNSEGPHKDKDGYFDYVIFGLTPARIYTNDKANVFILCRKTGKILYKKRSSSSYYILVTDGFGVDHESADDGVGICGIITRNQTTLGLDVDFKTFGSGENVDISIKYIDVPVTLNRGREKQSYVLQGIDYEPRVFLIDKNVLAITRGCGVTARSVRYI